MINVMNLQEFEILSIDAMSTIDGGTRVSEIYEGAAVICGVVAAVAVCIPGGQGVAAVAGSTASVCAGVSYVSRKLNH